MTSLLLKGGGDFMAEGQKDWGQKNEGPEAEELGWMPGLRLDEDFEAVAQ